MVVDFLDAKLLSTNDVGTISAYAIVWSRSRLALSILFHGFIIVQILLHDNYIMALQPGVAGRSLPYQGVKDGNPMVELFVFARCLQLHHLFWKKFLGVATIN